MSDDVCDCLSLTLAACCRGGLPHTVFAWRHGFARGFDAGVPKLVEFVELMEQFVGFLTGLLKLGGQTGLFAFQGLQLRLE